MLDPVTPLMIWRNPEQLPGWWVRLAVNWTAQRDNWQRFEKLIDGKSCLHFYPLLVSRQLVLLTSVWVSYSNPESVTLWIPETHQRYCFWGGFGVSIGFCGKDIREHNALCRRTHCISIHQKTHVPGRSRPVLSLRLTWCSVLSWHPRASLPACSVPRPICCTGSPSFRVQIKFLVSTLLHSAWLAAVAILRASSIDFGMVCLTFLPGCPLILTRNYPVTFSLPVHSRVFPFPDPPPAVRYFVLNSCTLPQIFLGILFFLV